jgi:phosphatidylglycerol---prolipoprotein diacylglyceryl transferase
MLVHPQFDPIVFSVGPLAVRWYGLMYLTAFGLFYFLGRQRLKQSQFANASGLDAKGLEDLLFWGALGVVLGGRLGYVLFYKPLEYLSTPWKAFAVWEGGMSFHGGLIGVSLALLLFCRRNKLKYLNVMDFVSPLIPAGLAAGRMGNFINGELWGRETFLPWGMIFPQANDNIVRHPSQLYQFAGEGILLFFFLWWYSKKPRPTGHVAGMFLIGYGICRFLVEYAREPDKHLGLLAMGFSMGQLLCLPMIALGAYLCSRK